MRRTLTCSTAGSSPCGSGDTPGRNIRWPYDAATYGGSCRIIATLPGAWRHFFMVEFVPPKRMRWTWQDFVIFFRGSYRVVEFRAVSIQHFASREEVLAYQRWRTRRRSENGTVL